MVLRVTSALAMALLFAFGFGASPSSAQDINCSDIATPGDAQAILDADPSDPFGLDGPIGPTTSGVPGVPCEGGVGGGPVTFESLFGGGNTDTSTDTGTTTTTTTSSTTLPDTGVGVTAGQQSGSAFLVLLALAGMFGLVALRGVRRA